METSRNTVLIVSDSQTANGLLPAFLEQPGIRLLSSPTYDEAMEIARGGSPDLIIEELSGSNGAGLELCRQFKQEPATRSTPLIAVVEPRLDGEAAVAGPDVLVHKPIVQREYFEAVSRFIPLPRRRIVRHSVNLRFAYHDAGRLWQAFSRDLSLYGAFLKTDRIVNPGTHLEVCFHLPGEVEEIRCSSVVRTVLPVERRARYVSGFGIEFEGIHEKDLARLQRFVGKHLG